MAKIELRLNPIAAAKANRNNLAAAEDILSTMNMKPKLIAKGANITTHLRGDPQIPAMSVGDIDTPIATRPLSASANVM
jgi:hypothetical protein